MPISYFHVIYCLVVDVLSEIKLYFLNTKSTLWKQNVLFWQNTDSHWRKKFSYGDMHPFICPFWIVIYRVQPTIFGLTRLTCHTNKRAFRLQSVHSKCRMKRSWRGPEAKLLTKWCHQLKTEGEHQNFEIVVTSVDL